MDDKANNVKTVQQTIKFKPSAKVQMTKKTPIAQLYEILVSQQKFPHFELVEQPIFKYRVHCDGISGELEEFFCKSSCFRGNKVKIMSGELCNQNKF